MFERVRSHNGPRDRRFRIEHAQHISPQDIPRFAKLGVIASMQPYHAIDDGRWAERVIGPSEAKPLTRSARCWTAAPGSRSAATGSWRPPTPMEGIYAAVTRRTLDDKHPDGWVPKQKISVEEALRAYTIDAAYAAFSDTSLGSLIVGKQADMVVLDRDIFQLPPQEITSARVEATIVGGEVVYRPRTGE